MCSFPDSGAEFVAFFFRPRRITLFQKGAHLAPSPRTRSDRRARRTRLALQNALHSLLTEDGWDGINVQKLCERADVGRSTFYLHFQNKEELLASGLTDLRNSLRERASAGAPGTLPFARLLIELIHEQHKLFRAVIGGRSGHIVRTRFRELVAQLIEEDISYVAAAGWRRDGGVRYIAGALVELLAWWIEAGERQAPDEIERHFRQLTAPVIEQLGRMQR